MQSFADSAPTGLTIENESVGYPAEWIPPPERGERRAHLRPGACVSRAAAVRAVSTITVAEAAVHLAGPRDVRIAAVATSLGA